MAGKAGGSWKVAYADFVTAMMAFFLVMWICGQDQKVRKSVSDYFADPLGTDASGNSKKPTRSGSSLENVETGNVPLQENTFRGLGRRSYVDRRPGQATRALAEWILHDKQANEYWHRQAREQLETARWSKDVKESRSTVEKTAIRLLAAQLQEEFARVGPTLDGARRAMILEAIEQINWTELAEDMIEQ